MGIIIRLAAFDDAKYCADIHAKSWSFAYNGIVPKSIIDTQNARWPMIWDKMLTNNTNSHYVIVFNSIIIGFLTIAVSRDADLKEHFYEIVGLYLDPVYIGVGYGKQAMDWIKKEIKSRGYEKISLWVLEENNSARRFYEKSGFVADGKINQAVLPMLEKLDIYLNAIFKENPRFSPDSFLNNRHKNPSDDSLRDFYFLSHI